MVRPAVAVDPESPAVFTLDELAERLGPPDAELLAALMDEESRESYVTLGAQIASSRVLTGAERLYGKAFELWQHASQEQKDELVGFSPELLAVGVSQAQALRELLERSTQVAQDTLEERSRRQAAAAAAFRRASSLRDHAATVLLGIAGRNASLRRQVKAAVGNAESAEHLALGLERLAGLGEKILAHRGDQVATRVKAARLTQAYLDRLGASAALLRQTDRDVGAPPGRRGQGDLDLADGINLHLLGTVVHAFEAAHDLDATIPRLVPIATRRLLGRRLRTREETAGARGDAAAAETPHPPG